MLPNIFNNREIIEWEIEKGRLPIKIYECLDSNETAPASHPVLVTFTQIRVVTREMVNAILQHLSMPDGLPRAANYLHAAVGGYTHIGQCVAAVKFIKANPAKAYGAEAPKIVLRNKIWMTKEDFEKYKDLPHIEAHDLELRSTQKRPVDSTIEWPETYSGGVLDPAGDLADSEKPPANKMPVRTGAVTTISSVPNVPKKPSSGVRKIDK